MCRSFGPFVPILQTPYDPWVIRATHGEAACKPFPKTLLQDKGGILILWALRATCHHVAFNGLTNVCVFDMFIRVLVFPLIFKNTKKAQMRFYAKWRLKLCMGAYMDPIGDQSDVQELFS